MGAVDIYAAAQKKKKKKASYQSADSVVQAATPKAAPTPSTKTVASVKKAVQKTRVPSYVPEPYRPMVRKASKMTGVSADLLAAQLEAESNFDPNAGSGAGAQGIAQFMPDTAASVGLQDPYDPEQAIMAQAQLMKDLIDQFGDPELALRAYNAGPGAVDESFGYDETNNYVAKIKERMGGDAGRPEFKNSQQAIRRLLGDRVKGDKEPGHAVGGDHDPNAPGYAQDIPLSGPNPAENEPAYDQELMERVRSKLKKWGAPLGPDDLRDPGDDWTGAARGQRFQIITDTPQDFHGSGPHGHFGARAAEGAVQTTSSSGGSPVAVSGSSGEPSEIQKGGTVTRGQYEIRRKLRKPQTYADEGYYSPTEFGGEDEIEAILARLNL